jgi:hypothetical protein
MAWNASVGRSGLVTGYGFDLVVFLSSGWIIDPFSNLIDIGFNFS